jgi:O-antigen/teichoic acid export membrane protein
VTQYSVPFNLVSRVLILPGSLSSALFPRFAVEINQRCNALLERGVHGLAVALTPPILLSMFGMRPFLTWWLGNEFAGDPVTVGQIIALGLWLNSLAHLPYTLLQGQSRPDLIAKCHLIELPLYLALLLIGLHAWGVVGVAAIWAVRVGLDAGLLFWLSGIGFLRLKFLGAHCLLLGAGAMVAFTLPPDNYLTWGLAMTLLLVSVLWSWRDSGFRLTKPSMWRVSGFDFSSTPQR